MRRAQRRLIREVVGEFDQHPAITDWVLGDHLSSSVEPLGPAVFEDWIHFIVGAAESARSRRALWHAISARDLVLASWLDPAVLRPPRIGLVVADDWRPRWATHGECWPAFLATFASALSDGTAVVSHLMERAISTHDLGFTLANAHAAGAAECVAPTLSELPDSIQHSSRSVLPAGPTVGLLDPSYRLTLSGRVWASIAKVDAPPSPTLHFELDLDLRKHDPEAVARTVYERVNV